MPYQLCPRGITHPTPPGYFMLYYHWLIPCAENDGPIRGISQIRELHQCNGLARLVADEMKGGAMEGGIMKEIQLYQGPKCWLATFLTDGKPDPEIIDLFGTHSIPTAYTSRKEYNSVVAQLRQLNPEHTISYKNPYCN